MTDLVESDEELLDPLPRPLPGPAAGSRDRDRPSALGRLAAAARRLRAGTPLGGDPDDPDGADPQRRQRLLRAGALALALAAGAGAAGVAVHRVDLHRDQARVQDRLLLHLLGGGASLTYAGTGARDGVSVPDSFAAPLATDLTIGLRNDGALPVEITGVTVRQPGCGS
ncbi:hypothetical protein ACFQ9X_05460 [Catenulispora yoronensis]